MGGSAKVAAVACAIVLSGCTSRIKVTSDDAGPGAHVDAHAGIDASTTIDAAVPSEDGAMLVDAAHPDAASFDARVMGDAGRDSGADASRDAGMDAGADAGRDGGNDAGRDAAFYDAGPIDAYRADGDPGPWQYATSATATSSYAAGDCMETGPYTPDHALGPPDCPRCLDYCAPGVTGPRDPCSWYPQLAASPEKITLVYAPQLASEVRVWTADTAPPGDVMTVEISDSASGTFTAVTGGVAVAGTCGSPRTTADGYSYSFILPVATSIGAVRVTMRDFNTAIDAVGIRSR